MALKELYNSRFFSDSALTAYYRMENNLTDSKGGNNLTQYGGGLTYDTGVFGNALKQNIYTNYARYDGALGGIDGGAITISMWVKDRNTRVSNGVTFGFGCYVNMGTKTRYTIGKRLINSGQKLIFKRDGIGGGVVEGIVSVPYSDYINTSSYTHLVLTYDGTNIKGYANGVFLGQQAASGNGTGYSGCITGFGIGAEEGWDGWNIIAGDYSADAFYDDCAIFNRCLTDSEVLELYHGLPSGFFKLLL